MVELTRPTIEAMVAEIKEAGYCFPEAVESNRGMIEHLYYLVVAAQPSMKDRKPESQCFGVWEEIAACNGDGKNERPCCLMPLCKEMTRIQEGLKSGKETKPNLVAPIMETAKNCCEQLVAEKQEKEEKMTAETVVKARTINPDLIDGFGFRRSSLRSKVAAVMAAGGQKAEILGKIQAISPRLATSLNAKLYFSLVKHALKKVGYTVTTVSGVVHVVKG